MNIHKTDAWRGYSIPDFAVLGCSVTDVDGPCPPDVAKEEIFAFQSFLSEKGRKTSKNFLLF